MNSEPEMHGNPNCLVRKLGLKVNCEWLTQAVFVIRQRVRLVRKCVDGKWRSTSAVVR